MLSWLDEELIDFCEAQIVHHPRDLIRYAEQRERLLRKLVDAYEETEEYIDRQRQWW